LKGLLNDLWVFNGTQWAWISGSTELNEAGIYDKENKLSIPGGRRGIRICKISSIEPN
jgi:hypothetical protein